MLLLPLQGRETHLAEDSDEVAEEADRLLQTLVGDHRYAGERLQVRGLVEAQPARPLGEDRRVDVVVGEEELPREDVGHMISGDEQGEGHVPESVAALVGVVLRRAQALDEPLVDAEVALETAAQRLGVLAVETRADLLPAGRDEHRAVDVEHRQRDVEGIGEAVAEALHAVEIDERRQLILA